MTMQTRAVVMTEPQRLTLQALALAAPGEGDVVVDVRWSAISTGTERLLWTGRMPPFPGMGYPLVPGYEACGEIVEAAPDGPLRSGDMVFVPGATCFGEVRGLFGAAASRLVVKASRLVPVDRALREQGVLLALAATAFHALRSSAAPGPLLIVGHGVLGRLLARLACLRGGEPPTVWETQPLRRDGAHGYAVVEPAADARRDYGCIIDASGDGALLDTLIGRLRRGGEVVLAGFYSAPLSFAFPPAFMREAVLRVAAEWQPSDLAAVSALIGDGRLSLDGLITHRRDAEAAAEAYPVAFDDPACLKLVLSWSAPS
jgi:3-hydroxyethyl bacteriochlorophyllide a dehydrogenase